MKGMECFLSDMPSYSSLDKISNHEREEGYGDQD
jgi:hypothetical protein